MSTIDLWEQYTKTKSKYLRNQIVVKHLPLVNYIAGRIIVQLPLGMDREDLTQYGIFGLIDAIERFDSNQGANFETYATIRIRGSILDRIREYGKASGGPSRTSVKKSKMIEEAMRKLEQKLGRHPTTSEISEQLGITEEEYNKMLTDISISMPISLDKMVGVDDNLQAIEVVENEKSINPETNYINKENNELLAKAIENLPPNEYLIIVYYYYEELTLKEIGKILNKSESRISQLHSQAIIRIKSKILGGE